MPVAVVGSEEIYPKLADLPAVARLIGAPYFPVTPTFPLARPARRRPAAVAAGGSSSWSRSRPPSYGPEAADDRALVLELSERVRAAIQQALYANLVRRGPAFI